MKKLATKYKYHIAFLIIYSILFLIIKSLFIYFLPFIIGLTVSLIMYPVYSFMKKRLSFKPAFSATVITLFIFAIVIAIVLFLAYLLISEVIKLYNNNLVFFNGILSHIDLPDYLKDINISGEMFTKISDTAFGIVKVVPVSITLLIISFVSTICIINNLTTLKKLILSKVPDNIEDNFQNLLYSSRQMFRKFVHTYLLLYSLTFVESLFIFFLIDLDYKFVFAFLAAVSDLLPVLGPGTVYLTIAIVKGISGEYLSAISLVVFWGIVIIIRQIIEPKILSDNIKIHPLVILSALYFSIVSSNIWVLFYITVFVVVYKILVESEVLQPVFSINIDSDDKES